MIIESWTKLNFNFVNLEATKHQTKLVALSENLVEILNITYRIKYCFQSMKWKINLLKGSQVFCKSIEAAADKIGCMRLKFWQILF